MSNSPNSYKQYYKLCQYDGTPVPLHEPVCSTCGLAVPRQTTLPTLINWLGILALTCMITYALVTLNQRVASTFQQASCTITATWSADPAGYGISIVNTFQPTALTYTIKNAQSQVLAQGNGDLNVQQYTSAYPGTPTPYVQTSSVQTSQTTPCWYSPYASPHVLWSQPANSIWWWAWSAGSGVVLILLYRCIVRFMIYPWQLVQRGVQTTGTVVDRTKRSVRGGYYYVATILYETQTTPALTGLIKKKEDLPVRSKVDVYYDFLNPTRNRKPVGAFRSGQAVASTIAGVLFILLLLGIQALIILTVLNFQGS